MGLGKKVLGKGLKDLLPQQKGADDKKSPKNIKMQKKKVELQKVVDEYREKGYTVTKLSKSLKKDIKAMAAAEKEFNEGLKKLEEVQEILKGLDLTGFDEEAKKIEERIKDPFRANELLEVVSVLEKTIIEMKDEELKSQEDKMDAWIQGQKKVMIDLMGIYKERAEDGSVPEAEGEAGEVPMDGEQAELRVKLEEWKGKGYLVTRLESILMDDINQAKEEFAAFEENIDKINRLNKRLENLNTEGYEAKVRLIKTKLNYPNLANEVEKEIIKLETKILGAPVEEPTVEEEPTADEEAAPEEEAPAPEEAVEGEIPETGEGEVAPEAAEGEVPAEAAEGEVAPEAGEDEGLFNPEEIMQEQQTEEEGGEAPEEIPEGEQPQEEIPEGEQQPQEEIPEGEEQPQEEIPEGEQPQEEIPEGEQPQEEVPEGEQPQEEIPEGEEQPQEEIPEGEQPQEEVPEGEQPQEEVPEGEQPQEEVPEGEQPQEEVPEGEQPQEEIPEGEQPQEEIPEGEQPQEEIPEGEQPQEEIPEGEQPQEEIPEGEQPQEEVPEGEQPQEEEAPGEEEPPEEGGGGDLFDPEAILKEMEGDEAPPSEEQPQEETPTETPGEETPQEEAPAEPETPAGPSEYGDNPEDLPQLLEEAQNAYRDRDFKKAVEYFDRVLALDPENSNAIFMRKRAASKL